MHLFAAATAKKILVSSCYIQWDHFRKFCFTCTKQVIFAWFSHNEILRLVSNTKRSGSHGAFKWAVRLTTRPAYLNMLLLMKQSRCWVIALHTETLYSLLWSLSANILWEWTMLLCQWLCWFKATVHVRLVCPCQLHRWKQALLLLLLVVLPPGDLL